MLKIRYEKKLKKDIKLILKRGYDIQKLRMLSDFLPLRNRCRRVTMIMNLLAIIMDTESAIFNPIGF